MGTTKKIAVACFIGGALCCAVALAVSPVYWWLGLLAGLAGGYLSYEFREVLKAIPIAMRKAGQSIGELRKYWLEKAEKARAFLAKPHPFLYLGIVFSTAVTILIYHLLILRSYGEGIHVMATCLTSLTWLGSPFLFFLLATEGAESLNHFWHQDFSGDSRDVYHKIKRLRSLGYTEKPLTYLNAYHWLVRGLVSILLTIMLSVWRAAVRWSWIVLRAIGLLFWHLFKLIHSEKRVLCAIDGTLGGAIAYVCLYAPAMPLAEHVALTIFGGLLGAVIGVLNWEIVSKRILHVAENTSA